MKTIALILTLAAMPFLGSAVAGAASDKAVNAEPATKAGQATDTSARKKMRRHRSVDRSYRYSYGYDRPYRGGYYDQGYYRGIRPGQGYGPDRGDYAWPPFHFKPYW